VVIALGVSLTICVILYRLPVSFTEFFEFLQDNNRLKLLDFSPNPTKLITVWSILIGMNIANLSMYMADQMSLQRYLAAGSIRSVSRSFLANTIGVIIVLTLLAFVGLLLFGWYHYKPDPDLPEKVDKIFPYFVATQLPPGIAGLLLAAILAATMSSMTSGINTLSATLSLDFRARMGKTLTPGKQLIFGKKVSLIVGLASTFAAGIVKSLGNIFEMTQALLGLFLGPILTCIFLALLKKPVNNVALVVGLITGLAAGFCASYSPIANPWVPAITFFTSVSITYIGTALFGHRNANNFEKKTRT
jgi:sodium-coupled monocarboxylate transporter 8/12